MQLQRISRENDMKTENSTVKDGLWLVLLTVASVLTTFVLACATPAAAFGALAALHMKRAKAMLLMSVVWFASQMVGFGFMHYPLDASTLAWGPALLLSGLVCMEGAAFVARQTLSPVLRTVGALLAAMVVFKVAIYIFGMGLGGNESAFAPVYVWSYIWTNAVTFAVLLLLHRAALAMGLVVRSSASAPLAA
jgi:hypothetical protein